MKVGDELDLVIQGIVVGKASVVARDTDTVTLQWPGQEVIVGVSSTLVDTERTPEVDRVLAGAVEEEKPEPQPREVTEPAQSLREMNLDSSVLDD